jgi:hypothetical protein
LPAFNVHPRNGPSHQRPLQHRNQAGFIFRPGQDAACAPFLAACFQPPAHPDAAANYLGHPPVPHRPAFFPPANLPLPEEYTLDIPIHLHVPAPARNARGKGWTRAIPSSSLRDQIFGPRHSLGPPQKFHWAHHWARIWLMRALLTLPPLGVCKGHCTRHCTAMTKWGVRIQSADDWGDVPMAVRGMVEEDVSPNCCASVTSSSDAWIPASSSEKAIPPDHFPQTAVAASLLAAGRRVLSRPPG